MDFDPKEFLAEQSDFEPAPMNEQIAPAQMTQAPETEFEPVESGLEQAAFDPKAFIAEQQNEKYGSTGQMAITALEGAAQGALGPVAPYVEKHILNVPAEDIRARAEENPVTNEVGKAAGFIGSMAVPVGQGALIAKVGRGAAEAAGLARAAEGASLAAKVGSSIVQNAAEMAVLQSGDEVSKMILQDPNASAESALANIGLASALGGAAGGVLTGIGSGIISPLWSATAGPKVEGMLKSLKSRVNQESASTLMKEADELGISKKLTADIEGAMSDDPFLKNAASGLRQTDTSSIARGFQAREQEFKKEVTDKMTEALGRNADSLSTLDMSEAVHGKEIGDSLVKEYKSRLDPIITELTESKSKFKDTLLDKDIVTSVLDNSNPYQPAMKEVVRPGTTRNLADKITTMAGEEGWLADRLSPEARFIKTTIKELGAKNSLQDLVKFGENIGQSTKSTLPFGMQTPLSRAGTMVRQVIRDAENDVIMARLGKEMPDLVDKFRGALANYKEVAQLKDALNDRLKIGGSVSGFAKGLAEMAKTDSEALVRKLSGAKDANLLNFMTETFPETAAKIRQFHLDKVIEKSMKDGALVPSKLMKQIEGMSPELREFALGPQAVEKVERLNGFLNKLIDQNHNYSNTARTVDKVLSSGAASATGLIAALMGHGGIGLALPIAETVGKEGVAAARLGMLKFLGSSQEVKGAGFKAMIGHIDAIYRHEHMLNKAVKNVFKGSAQVLTSSQMPNERSREKLDKVVTRLQKTPGQAMNMAPGGDLAHYMPDQQSALTQASANALSYLQSIKPQPHILGPLDKPVPPQPSEIARYNRALDIAQKPAVVLEHVKNGTLQPSDIKDLYTMYPSLYKQMSQKLLDSVVSQQGADEMIPYRTRIGISLFLGQPLDATMSPSAIVAAQPIPPQGPPAPGQPPAKARNAPSALGKTNKSYMTPGQGAEADRQDRS